MYIFAKGAVMLKMSKELFDEQLSSELRNENYWKIENNANMKSYE